eukprot:1975493-Pyramimonas_sp.AAC.1
MLVRGTSLGLASWIQVRRKFDSRSTQVRLRFDSGLTQLRRGSTDVRRGFDARVERAAPRRSPERASNPYAPPEAPGRPAAWADGLI